MKMLYIWCWVDGGGRLAWSKKDCTMLPLGARQLRMRQSTFKNMEKARVNFNRVTQKARELLKVTEGME